MDVIYDGQCGFCIRSLQICRALDWRGTLRFQDANARTEMLRSFPELAAADVEHAMFVVSPGRQVSRGFFAFRRIALGLPLMWPLLPVLYFPGSGWVGPKVYAWVARNRHRLGCRSAVCDIPQGLRQRD